MTNSTQEIIHTVEIEFDDLLKFVLVDSRHTSVYEVERTLWRSLLNLGFRLLQLWFQLRCEQYGREPLLAEDGSNTPFLEDKERSFYSVFGKLKIPRPYFYRRGGQGASPLDELLGLGDDSYSDLLRQMHELLAVYTSYGKSVELMNRFLGIKLSTRVVQRLVDKDAVDVVAYYDKQKPPAPKSEAEIFVLQGDGKGVPMIQETFQGKAKLEKKEAIVTSAYTIASQPRTPEAVLSSYFDGKAVATEQTRPQNKQVWATLAGKDEAFRRLQRQVEKREGNHLVHRVALCDGDPALQNRFGSYCPTFTLILDFIHADEYLWDAAKLLFTVDDPQRKQWVRDKAELMLNSQTQQLITQLRCQATAPTTNEAQRAELHKAANYFERNHKWMDYRTYLSQGWPIASGVIEGACRHLVKDRMEGSGMHWRKPTAEAMLALRAVAENDDWDDYHAFRRQRRQRRLYYPDATATFVPVVYHQLPLAF